MGVSFSPELIKVLNDCEEGDPLCLGALHRADRAPRTQAGAVLPQLPSVLNSSGPKRFRKLLGGPLVPNWEFSILVNPSLLTYRRTGKNLLQAALKYPENMWKVKREGYSLFGKPIAKNLLAVEQNDSFLCMAAAALDGLETEGNQASSLLRNVRERCCRTFSIYGVNGVFCIIYTHTCASSSYII